MFRQTPMLPNRLYTSVRTYVPPRDLRQNLRTIVQDNPNYLMQNVIQDSQSRRMNVRIGTTFDIFENDWYRMQTDVTEIGSEESLIGDPNDFIGNETYDYLGSEIPNFITSVQNTEIERLSSLPEKLVNELALGNELRQTVSLPAKLNESNQTINFNIDSLHRTQTPELSRASTLNSEEFAVDMENENVEQPPVTAPGVLQYGFSLTKNPKSLELDYQPPNEPPVKPPINRFGSGFPDGSNYSHVLFYLLIFTFFVWVYISLMKAILNYIENHFSLISQDKKNPTGVLLLKYRDKAKKLFANSQNWLLAFLLFLLKLLLKMFGVKIGAKVLQNVIPSLITDLNRVIAKTSKPLFKLFLSIFGFLFASLLSIQSLKFLLQYLNPTLNTFTANFIGVNARFISSDPSLLFLTVTNKCLICAVLCSLIIYQTGQILSKKFNGKYMRYTSSITSLAAFTILITVLHQDQTWVLDLSRFLSHQVIFNTMLKSQVGRIGIIVTYTYSLNTLKEILPGAPVFFLIYSCLLKIYVIALTATPNFF